MTFISIILGLPLLAGVALATELLRGNKNRARIPAVTPAKETERGAGDYRPIGRLFLDEDFALVADAPGLGATLDASRRQALRLYLRQLRAEYMELFAVCRTLAPIAPDPDFAARLLRQSIEFHLVFAGAMVWSYVPGHVRQAARAADLVGALGRMREAAETLLRAADPAGMASAGAAA